ncbi:MAG: hypothetical protein MUF08_10520 [Burkholderiaceae bacterium]|jgi:hypothetical protein|nr:hypothetical protein [Burkholderiaceae bacterium]
MDQPARLYLCARCRVQVILCSRCDRGNRYCGRQCGHQARVEARRQTAQRYQRSRQGRIAHAQRSRRWRVRRAARHAIHGTGVDAHNVTHQGSQPGVAADPLGVWTHDSATVAPADTVADITAQSAPQELAIVTLPTVAPYWACRRCGERQPAALRLGFMRHGLQARWRHDHSP